MAFQMFKQAPDGIYDHREYLIRYVVVEGNPITTINKAWIDGGVPSHLPTELHQPWGTFPDIPPKIKK